MVGSPPRSTHTALGAAKWNAHGTRNRCLVPGSGLARIIRRSRARRRRSTGQILKGVGGAPAGSLPRLWSRADAALSGEPTGCVPRSVRTRTSTLSTSAWRPSSGPSWAEHAALRPRASRLGAPHFGACGPLRERPSATDRSVPEFRAAHKRGSLYKDGRPSDVESDRGLTRSAWIVDTTPGRPVRDNAIPRPRGPGPFPRPRDAPGHRRRRCMSSCDDHLDASRCA